MGKVCINELELISPIKHDELKRQYNEVQAVETTLRKRIIDAIEDVYLQPLRDSSTDMIQCDISTIFDFLRSTYGRLSPTQLKTKENEIDSIIHDLSCNVDIVFNKIQDFQDLCIMLNNDKTDTLLVTYAYLIFQKADIFMDELASWNAKTASDFTFTNFETHMRK